MLEFLLITSLLMAATCTVRWFRTGELLWATIAAGSANTAVIVSMMGFAPDEWTGLLMALSGALLMLTFVLLYVVVRKRRVAKSGL